MAAQRAITCQSSIDAIVRAYVDKGWSLARLAEKYGVAVTTIRNYLIEEGVELRPRGGRSAS